MKPITPKKISQRRERRFKKYKELIARQPNLRRDTLAKKIRCLEIEVTAMKQRHEAETAARRKLEDRTNRPTLIRDRQGRAKHAKRKKIGRVNW